MRKPSLDKNYPVQQMSSVPEKATIRRKYLSEKATLGENYEEAKIIILIIKRSKVKRSRKVSSTFLNL